MNSASTSDNSATNELLPESEINALLMGLGSNVLLKSLYKIAIVGGRMPPENYDPAELNLLRKYGLVSVMDSDPTCGESGGIFLTKSGENIYRELLLKTSGIKK